MQNKLCIRTVCVFKWLRYLFIQTNVLYSVKANIERNISFNKAKWKVLNQCGFERQSFFISLIKEKQIIDLLVISRTFVPFGCAMLYATMYWNCTMQSCGKKLQSKLVNLNTRSSKAMWCCISHWLIFPVFQPGKIICMELWAALLKLLPVSVHICSKLTCPISVQDYSILCRYLKLFYQGKESESKNVELTGVLFIRFDFNSSQ